MISCQLTKPLIVISGRGGGGLPEMTGDRDPPDLPRNPGNPGITVSWIMI